jgi:hypothetical protein
MLMRLLAFVALLLAFSNPSTALAQETCDDFETQDEAQSALNDANSDELDPDGDGIACDSLPDEAESSEGDLTADTQSSPCAVSDEGDNNEETEAEAGLDGRLGGSRAGFESVYGEPVDDEFFIEYDIEDCGTVFTSYFEDEVVIDIAIFSPREDEEKEFTEPDEADWTVAQAEQIVKNFLPTDAEDGDTLVEDESLIMVEGFSETLEQEVPEAAYDYGDNTPTYGGYSYALHLTNGGEVYWITVQLNIED